MCSILCPFVLLGFWVFGLVGCGCCVWFAVVVCTFLCFVFIVAYLGFPVYCLLLDVLLLLIGGAGFAVLLAFVLVVVCLLPCEGCLLFGLMLVVWFVFD